MTTIWDIPNKATLSSIHQDILQRQAIDENGPGLILRDFFSLLDFIGPEGIQVTGQHHLLPLRCLPDLNARMTFPLQLGLKRPQQKSYPHINGLYLLLRGSGLSRIEASGAKPRLVLDETVLASWAELTSTEQYFTLLESWLLRADPVAIGEREGLFRFDHPLQGWDYFFTQIPEQGLIVAGRKDVEDSLRHHPKLHNLALLELFGFATVQPNPPQAKAGWQIGRIWKTPLGEAMLQLLYDTIARNVRALSFHQTAPIPFGALQPVLQPYFPAWKRNLVIPEREFEAGIHIFKVSFGTGLWRRIGILGDLTLDILSAAILDAYGFAYDHLDRFTYTDRFGVSRRINHFDLEWENEPTTDEVRIGELPLAPGDVMIYLFDFGVGWEFDVALERIAPAGAEITQPEILEGRGQAPEQYGWGDYEP